MLTLDHVSKIFGKAAPAVDDVSFVAKAGVLGLIGHNGAGKTTLMQMIATLTKPSAGQIFFHDEDIVETPNAIRNCLGFLPQDFGVYPNLSALEFMQYFAALKGVKDPQRIRHLLELVNLHDQAHRSAAEFSGGMRRRLGIAQALLNDPEILVVDEPTAGLDPEERLRFRNLLAELGQEKLVIMSTHIVSDVEHIASQLAILRNGKLLAFATPEQLLEQARGRIWSATVDSATFAELSKTTQVLNTQRSIVEGVAQHEVRIAHPVQPCAEAELSEPSLEDALMAHGQVSSPLPVTA